MTKFKATRPAPRTAARRKITEPTGPSSPKPERKTDRLLALLKRKGGATLAEITGSTGWQPHSARAVLTGFRKRGYIVERFRADGVTRWSITMDPAQ